MRTISSKTRHLDRGVLLATFAARVLGVCPRCGSLAIVTCDSQYAIPYIPQNARVHCSKCSFELRSVNQEWFGPINLLRPNQYWFGPAMGVGRTICGNCGYKWLNQKVHRNRLTPTTRKWTTIECPSCEQATKVPLTWTTERFSGAAIDPVFGLPLYLQARCCGETLWVYNREHLNKLREYTHASLRERVNGRHWSMFARLPRWMSAAKNRESVLASLEKLESKLGSVSKSIA